MWSLLASPLLIGADMTKMDDFTLSLLTNDEVIAVNQDALGKQGVAVSVNGNLVVFSKPLEDGSLAVGLFNRGPAEAVVKADWWNLGLKGSSYTVRDLWRQKDLGRFTDSFSSPVASHGVRMVRIYRKQG